MKIILLVLFLSIYTDARQIKKIRNETSKMEKFKNEYSNRIAFGESGTITFVIMQRKLFNFGIIIANIEDFPHMLAMISAETEGKSVNN